MIEGDRLNKKRDLGQFFTKNQVWLQPQIIEFISSVKTDSVLDPFAGNGDLGRIFWRQHISAFLSGGLPAGTGFFSKGNGAGCGTNAAASLWCG